MSSAHKGWRGRRRIAGASCGGFLATIGLLVLPSSGGPVQAATPFTTCTSSSQATKPLSLPVRGQTATGLYALPSSAPRGIVVVGHGHTGDAASVAGLVRQIATTDDVVALAMDYRGTNLKTLFGWRVIEGAQDSIAATQMFDAFCPGGDALHQCGILGISMGGNPCRAWPYVSSGATARSDGQPLFDYWFDVSGRHQRGRDLRRRFSKPISLAPVSALSSTGSDGHGRKCRPEFGGTPLTNPLAYLANSPVARTAAMKASGLKGVFYPAWGHRRRGDLGHERPKWPPPLALAGIPTDLSIVGVQAAPAPRPVSRWTATSSAIAPGYVSPLSPWHRVRRRARCRPDAPHRSLRRWCPTQRDVGHRE